MKTCARHGQKDCATAAVVPNKRGHGKVCDFRLLAYIHQRELAVHTAAMYRARVLHCNQNIKKSGEKIQRYDDTDRIITSQRSDSIPMYNIHATTHRRKKVNRNRQTAVDMMSLTHTYKMMSVYESLYLRRM